MMGWLYGILQKTGQKAKPGGWFGQCKKDGGLSVTAGQTGRVGYYRGGLGGYEVQRVGNDD